MTKKSLSGFDKTELSNLMKYFGSEPRVFNSEAQFQFELGWRIKEHFDCEVKFEELSRVYEGKKDYTDLILQKDSLRIAIELKYKTAEYEDEVENILLKNHGAADLGRYDFMWDIHRVQTLTGLEKADGVRIRCNRDYAVILTNDVHYWDDKNKRDCIDRDFLIGGDRIIKKGHHQWYTTEGEVGLPSTVEGTSRQVPIEITTNIMCKWEDYCITKEKNGVFRFMVVEV